MDLSALTGGNPSGEEKAPGFAYTAQVTSPLDSGEAKVTIGDDGLNITTLFGASELPYADILSLAMPGYDVAAETAQGRYVFSRMGQWCQPFYDALLEAYNKKVLKALFVAGAPVLTAKGTYTGDEFGQTIGGAAPVRVYENCVCVLPPDTGARRIPLCFLTAMDRTAYETTLRIGGDERYTMAKLGYDADPFAAAIEQQMHKQREASLAAVKDMAPALSMREASAVAVMMPMGAAAPLGRIAARAPAFVAAMEQHLAAGRAAETYRAFREMCDPAQIYIGFKKNAASAGDAGGVNAAQAMAGLLPGGAQPETAGETPAEAAPPAPYLIWMAVPAPNGRVCAVEFAGEEGDAAATFIYRFEGGFDAFAAKLSRALEAIDFKREIIRLTDDELQQPGHADARMAVQRNAALRFVRACFAGRVIHRSLGSWRSAMAEHFSQSAESQATHGNDTEEKGDPVIMSENRFFSNDVPSPADVTCPACGHPNAQGMRFCSECGAKMEIPAPQPPPPAGVTCPACGKINAQGMRFCSECGVRVDEIPAPPQPEPEPEPEPEQGACPACGKVNAPGMRFCSECGVRLDVQPEPEPELQPVENICAACGTVNLPEDCFCGECGTKLGPPPEPEVPEMPPELALDMVEYKASANITVMVTGISQAMAENRAFVAIYAQGAPHEAYGVYQYPQAGDGQLVFTAPGAGAYEMRLYKRDGDYTDESFAVSAPFTVIPSEIVCPACDARYPIESGKKFCTACGAKLMQ